MGTRKTHCGAARVGGVLLRRPQVAPVSALEGGSTMEIGTTALGGCPPPLSYLSAEPFFVRANALQRSESGGMLTTQGKTRWWHIESHSCMQRSSLSSFCQPPHPLRLSGSYLVLEGDLPQLDVRGGHRLANGITWMNKAWSSWSTAGALTGSLAHVTANAAHAFVLLSSSTAEVLSVVARAPDKFSFVSL